MGYVAKTTGLSIQQAMFADLVACGMGLTAAFKKSFPDSAAKPDSINVIACRMAQRPDIKARIEMKRADEAGNRDLRLLDREWLQLEVLSGFYQLATSANSESVRLSALQALAGTRIVDLMAPRMAPGGVNVNVQTNQIAPGSSEPGQIRASLMKELQEAIGKKPVMIEGEVIAGEEDED